MAQLSENYYLRKCFLERKQVPTQSMIREKMTPALANVYFKSMLPKVKVLAGLEPPLKGGGVNWYMPPSEILQSKSVLKPASREILKKLTNTGIDEIGFEYMNTYRHQLRLERRNRIREREQECQAKMAEVLESEWNDRCAEEAAYNTEVIRSYDRQFDILYTSSINKYQDLLFDAAVDKIKTFREQTMQKMQTRYETFLNKQATMLYDRYAKKLEKHKAKLKWKFINDLKILYTKLGNRLHDINLEKHVAVEKLRHLLKCQNLACQTYIILKERDHCLREMELTTQEYKKKVGAMAKEIELQDFKIHIEQQKVRRREEFDNIWKKKVCHIVEHFQMFVSYCLRVLPEQADFFINMEKLMLLQLNEAWDNPRAQSIIIEEHYSKPEEPRPFYIFCDKSAKLNIARDLSPRRSSSSALPLPVIIVNKRCLYSTCDNFEQFTDKIISYIEGQRGDDADFEDHHDYSGVPVTYTDSQQYKELKLEGSLMQILQEEIANIIDVLPELTKYNVPRPTVKLIMEAATGKKTPSPDTFASISSSHKIKSRSEELVHIREPKWQSFMQYVKPKRCVCSRFTKKHLLENLPAYMRNVSPYEEPKMMNYETCSVDKLKLLVKQAKGEKDIPPPPPKLPSNTKDIAIQCYVDRDFEYLCTCYSDEDIQRFYDELIVGGNIIRPFDNCDYMSPESGVSWFQLVGATTSQTYLTKENESFMAERVLSLRRLLDITSEVKEIYHGDTQ